MYRSPPPSLLQQSSSLQDRLQDYLGLSTGNQRGSTQRAMFDGSESASVTSALGTLIGYVGSEAATEDVFERLLWPQRFFNDFSWRDMIQVGLLNTMAGPMHKAALTTLDQFHQNGLFHGRSLGNMLGTAFFHDTKLGYKLHDPPPPSSGEEFVRNGLWVQAIRQIPVVTRSQKDNNVESGMKPRRLVRAHSVVNLLELSYVDGKLDPLKTVKSDVGSVTFRTFLAIIWSEITGIAIAVFVLAFWRSYFAVIWFLPVTLRLISAVGTIQREGLLANPSAKDTENEEIRRFEVNTGGHGFLLVEGKESTVLQFFRHYGHPIRNRAREVLQITTILGLGLVFPIGLMTSLLWMSVELQYLWLGHQLYATMAMYVYRFTRHHQRATSQARLAQKFAAGKDEERVAFLQDQNGTVMKGKLTQITVDNYGEGQKVLREYLSTGPAKGCGEKTGD
ncbi:MAG: hypothetical protein Q9168_004704 [Polycauliona sp. 1 TL-2023]